MIANGSAISEARVTVKIELGDFHMKNEMIASAEIAANGPARKEWITPEIQEAPVSATAGKTSDEIEAGATFKYHS